MIDLAKLLSPAVALGVLKHEIQKQLGEEIESFRIMFISNLNDEQILAFRIKIKNNEDIKKMNYRDDKLLRVIKHFLDNDLSENSVLDGFEISVGLNVVAKLYYTENGEKIVKQSIL